MNTSASTSGKASVFSLFRNRFVQAIMLSGLFMHLGIWIRNFAVLLYVTEMTKGNSYAVSMVYVAEFAPIFVFSFIGGTFADRWRPKLTMIWCEVLSALSVFLVLFTIMLGSWQAVFFTTFISAILSQFSQPSSMKLFKQHVPEEMLQASMSIFQTMGALFMLIGPGIGTLLFQAYGITTSLVVTGIAFLLSAAALRLLPADSVQSEKKAKESTVRKELAAGFRYVMQSKLLKPLGGCFAMAGLAVGLIQPMGIFLITERLLLDKSYLSVMLMVNAVAMLIGGAIAMILSRKLPPQHMLALGMIMSCMTILVVAFSDKLWIILVAQFLNGLVMPSLQIGINTLILKNTESSFIGRVNGILNPMFIGAMVVSMSISGIIKEAASLTVLYEVASAFFFLGIIIMIPLLRMGNKAVPIEANQAVGVE
ncbi:MFS transporter [Paenibacillus marinisediminis]